MRVPGLVWWGIGDEGLEVVRVEAGGDVVEAWRFAGGGCEGVGLVAGDAVEFFDEGVAFEGRVEGGGIEAGDWGGGGAGENEGWDEE